MAAIINNTAQHAIVTLANNTYRVIGSLTAYMAHCTKPLLNTRRVGVLKLPNTGHPITVMVANGTATKTRT